MPLCKASLATFYPLAKESRRTAQLLRQTSLRTIAFRQISISPHHVRSCIRIPYFDPGVEPQIDSVSSDLDGIFSVIEYMEHDLKGLMERMNEPFHLSEIKCLMLQLLFGVKHLHDNLVLHRDLKPSNIIFNNRGELMICEFYLSRQYGSPSKPYTQLVVTLWYRLQLGLPDLKNMVVKTRVSTANHNSSWTKRCPVQLKS
ncbi:Cyclin-dependent kinase G-2 [Platanthera guangdongensis]|uniref:[RNA-polymerase]-subunit kinase n=1 Tax=Platanthera guangdongensis TaxID=2320717 RepID=A0ABR2MAJ3_9ASPA